MKFFRDFLDGPVYIVAVILSIILIMAIIGFIMERKKLEKEANNKVVHIDNNDVSSNEPVSVQETNVPNVSFEPVNNTNNEIPVQEENSVETPVIVFKEPEEKE